MTSQELSVVKPEDYRITKIKDAVKALTVAAGGDKLGINDLDRVKIPAGGGTHWKSTGLAGETMLKEIQGIIIHLDERRVYWKEKYESSGGAKAPDCASFDGILGKGEPGGPCSECTFAEWESSKGGEGRGQACKRVRRAFVVSRERLLPRIIMLPPTSIYPMKKYLLGLADEGFMPWGVETKFTLKEDTNKDGVSYAKLVVVKTNDLSPEAIAGVEAYRNSIEDCLMEVEKEEITQDATN